MLDIAYREAYCRANEKTQKSMDQSLLEGAALAPEGRCDTPSIVADTTKQRDPKSANARSLRFNIGDSVVVYPQKKIGIVFRKANEKGEVGVQIQKKKEFINHKRLQLKASASELYPEDYDFSIIFDSVANRKARHRMEKGYQSDLEIVYEKEQLM